jgi:16S rRNA processing protein RimM
MNLKEIRIAKIVGCHGLRGNLKLKTTSEHPVWLGKLAEVFLEDPASSNTPGKLIQVDRSWQHNPGIMIKLAGYDTRTDVEPLIGRLLFADLSAFEAEDEYWADDLIGLSVQDHETGQCYGKVVDLISSTGSDFLEIELEPSRQKVVVPFNPQFFGQVNLEQGYIKVEKLQSFFNDANTSPSAK